MDIEDAKNIMWLGLSFLFVAGGFGLGYAMWRTGRLIRTAEAKLHTTVDEAVLMIGKAGVTMDSVNVQMQKVDVMMDSAVDMTEAIDTTVRAISFAVTEPVKKASGVFAGVGEAVTSFRDRVTAEFDDDGFGYGNDDDDNDDDDDFPPDTRARAAAGAPAGGD